LAMPGYAGSILGFNLSNDGGGTTLYAALGIANSVLPTQLRLTITTVFTDQVWIASTFALYTIVVAVVWAKARVLGPVDIVLLGLLAWLIPLKIEYTQYMAWAIIPVLMRGQLKQTIPVLGLLQAADTLAYWSWWPNMSPVSGISTVDGLAAAGMLYRVLGLLALGFVLYSVRRKSPILPIWAGRGQASLEGLAREESPLVVRN
jgi:hypothetical protein